jgi:predicted phosphodiesterase
MTPIALFYDVHGNLPALAAVIEDAREQGAARFILGGDYALFGPYPKETVASLRALGDDAVWIRGNVDRWAANPTDAPDLPLHQSAIAACREQLGDEVTIELGALPEQHLEDGTRYCHASPASDLRSFLPDPADDEAELLQGVTECRLVFGHTHLPFRRKAQTGIELVNPGSVGMPLDGDTRAAYALLHDDDTSMMEQRRVDYNAAASAAALRERFAPAPFAETIARRIETARMESG